jgi:DNA invertase Pin-like site-specific DNA recombinase
MKIWYARVSTTGQKLEVQLDKLNAAGCDRIFEEKRSGGTRAERLELKNALTYIREGDQLVITRLDRLARSVLDLTQITKEIESKQVDLIVLDQSIDTSSPTGRLLFHMLAAIGEFERDLIKDRAADGIARAKAAGVKFGARSKLSADQVADIRLLLVDPANDRSALARRYKISRATVYRIAAG